MLLRGGSEPSVFGSFLRKPGLPLLSSPPPAPGSSPPSGLRHRPHHRQEKIHPQHDAPARSEVHQGLQDRPEVALHHLDLAAPVALARWGTPSRKQISGTEPASTSVCRYVRLKLPGAPLGLLSRGGLPRQRRRLESRADARPVSLDSFHIGPPPAVWIETRWCRAIGASSNWARATSFIPGSLNRVSKNGVSGKLAFVSQNGKPRERMTAMPQLHSPSGTRCYRPRIRCSKTFAQLVHCKRVGTVEAPAFPFATH